MFGNNWLQRFQSWARSAPPQAGPLVDGKLNSALNVKSSVVLVIDSAGRVFQVMNGEFSDGTFVIIKSPRSEVVRLMDKFGVHDENTGPELSHD